MLTLRILRGVEISARAVTSSQRFPLSTGGRRFSQKSSDGEDSSSDSGSSSDSDGELSRKDAGTPGNPEAKRETKLTSLLSQLQQKQTVSNKLDVAIEPRNVRQEKFAPFMENKEKKPEPTAAAAQSFEKKLSDAAEKVASAFPGEDKTKIESELLSRLLNSRKTGTDKSSTSWSDTVSSMKVEKPAKVQKSVTAMLQEAHARMGSPKRSRPVHRVSVRDDSLESKKPLGIFTPEVVQSFPDKPAVELSTWDQLHQKHVETCFTFPPENYFQEMIQWTEEGKLWKFPIDNEQGMEEEQNVHFSEHVFMERHLEGWCPTKGPIRHFMELVCVGLSKNPYMTVTEKKDHIAWYREYFESKWDLLKEIGAVVEEIPASKGNEISA